jgi:hypothetical protein
MQTVGALDKVYAYVWMAVRYGAKDAIRKEATRVLAKFNAMFPLLTIRCHVPTTRR